MTAYFTNSDVTMNAYGTPVYVLADGDTLYVGEGATLAALGGTAPVIMAGAALTAVATEIAVNGDLYSANSDAIWTHSTSQQITIGATGSLTAHFTGINAYLAGTGSTVVRNSGLIDAGIDAIAISGGSGHVIVNDGRLLADSDGIYVDGASDIINNGTISGGDSGQAIALGVGHHSILNTGTISGVGNAILGLYGAASLAIVNTGTIAAKWAAIQGANFEDSVTNGGMIAGAVNLGGGNDTFDGSNGTVTGAVSGGAGFDVLIGGEAVDRLSGDDGNDTLSGNGGADVLQGGSGDDTMAGGAGNDVLFVDSGFDEVHEEVGGGIDTVYAAVSYTLAPGQEIENLYAMLSPVTLTGNAFSNNIRGGGNADVLRGGDGDDRLNGLSGNDVMEGGEGDDIFFVDAAGDKVVELAGEGADRVHASVSYTLGAGQEVETLATSDRHGTSAINLSGNGLANRIVGNAGANVLNGGAGADTMAGGAGNDIYMVDNAGDRVFEAVDAGIDRVHASVGHVLGANVEDLALTGAGAINGIGNELANALTGNAAVNVLNGAAGNDGLNGGLGNDWLVGGAGLDTFLFSTALSASGNVDTIADFSHADDTIRLSKSIFTAFAAQAPNTALAAGALADWDAADEADDRILYRHLDGSDADTAKDQIWLYYDANGGTHADAVLFAKLVNQPSVTLTANDFLIVA